MKRHPEYKYKIDQIDSNNSWIFINDKSESGWEECLFDNWNENSSTGPVEFLLRIKEKTKWNIKEVNPFGYQFIEDDLKMVFRWDDLFGFTISTKNWNELENVLLFLKQFTND